MILRTLDLEGLMNSPSIFPSELSQNSSVGWSLGPIDLTALIALLQSPDRESCVDNRCLTVDGMLVSSAPVYISVLSCPECTITIDMYCDFCDSYYSIGQTG